jgi:hypothetical protein
MEHPLVLECLRRTRDASKSLGEAESRLVRSQKDSAQSISLARDCIARSRKLLDRERLSERAKGPTGAT